MLIWLNDSFVDFAHNTVFISLVLYLILNVEDLVKLLVLFLLLSLQIESFMLQVVEFGFDVV